MRALTSAISARSSRTDFGPFCRRFPFAATRALPAAVLGPVDAFQGRFVSAAWRSRSRPSGVKPRRRDQFFLPAATRFELVGEWLVWDMVEDLVTA